MPAAKLRPVVPSTTTVPPVMYSQPLSPTPSTTGRNFAAGMSGGLAYVLDLDGEFAKRCNPAMVDLEPLADAEDETTLRRLIESHQRYTGSKRAADILAAWQQHRARFIKVFPKEYRRALAELGQKKVAA